MSYELFTTVPDILHTSILPVGKQAVQGLLQKMGISHYFEERLSFEAFGYTNTVCSDEHNNPTFSENCVDVQISYSFQDDSLRWQTGASALEFQQIVNGNSVLHSRKNLFRDTINKILAYGYERPLAMGINCDIKLEAGTDAIDVMQRIKSFCSTGVIEFETDYNYILPPEICGILYILYKQAGYPPSDFFNYLSSHSNGQISRLENRHDGSTKEIAVRCSKVKMVLSVAMTQDIPEPIGSDKSPLCYQVSVNLQTQINMINLLGIFYPPVVNNILIPTELIPISREVLDPIDDAEYPFFSVEALRQYIFSEKKIKDPARYPWYDNWNPLEIPMGCMPSLIGIVLLDDIDNPEGVTVVNLPSSYTIVKSSIWELYKLCGQSVLSGSGLVNVLVYKDQVMVSPDSLTIDSDLNLTIAERDRSSIYRIVLAYNSKIQGVWKDEPGQPLKSLCFDIDTKPNLVKSLDIPEKYEWVGPPRMVQAEATPSRGFLLEDYIHTSDQDESSFATFMVNVAKEIIEIIPTEPTNVPTSDDGVEWIEDGSAEFFAEVQTKIGSTFSIDKSAEEVPLPYEEPPEDSTYVDPGGLGSSGDYSIKDILTTSLQILAQSVKHIPTPTEPSIVPVQNTPSNSEVQENVTTVLTITSVRSEKIAIPTEPVVVPAITEELSNLAEKTESVLTVSVVSEPIEPDPIFNIPVVVPPAEETFFEVSGATAVEHTTSKFVTCVDFIGHKLTDLEKQGVETLLNVDVTHGNIGNTSAIEGVKGRFSIFQNTIQDFEIVAEVNDEVRLTFGVSVSYDSIYYPQNHLVGDIDSSDIENDNYHDEFSESRDSVYNQQFGTSFKMSGEIEEISPSEIAEGVLPQLRLLHLRDKQRDLEEEMVFTFSTLGNVSSYPTAVGSDFITPKVILLSKYDWVEELKEGLDQLFKTTVEYFDWGRGVGTDNVLVKYTLLKKADPVYENNEELLQEFETDVLWIMYKEPSEEFITLFDFIVLKEHLAYALSTPLTLDAGTTFKVDTTFSDEENANAELGRATVDSNVATLDLSISGQIGDLVPMITVWEVPEQGGIVLPIPWDNQSPLSTATGTVVLKDNVGTVVASAAFVGEDPSQFNFSGLGAGTYTVELYGTLPRFGFQYDGTSKDLLVEVVQFGELGLTTLKQAFDHCTNLQSITSGKMTLSGNFGFSCAGCLNLTQVDLSGLMGVGYSGLVLEESFKGDTSLTHLNLSGLPLTGSLNSAFEGCVGLTDTTFIAANIDVSMVTSRVLTFEGCTNLSPEYIESTFIFPTTPYIPENEIVEEEPWCVYPEPGVHDIGKCIQDPHTSECILTGVFGFSTMDWKITARLFTTSSYEGYQTQLVSYPSGQFFWAVHRYENKWYYIQGDTGGSYTTGTVNPMTAWYVSEKEDNVISVSGGSIGKVTLKTNPTLLRGRTDTEIQLFSTVSSGSGLSDAEIAGVTIWTDATRTKAVCNLLPVPVGSTAYSPIPAPSNCFFCTIRKAYFEATDPNAFSFIGTPPERIPVV